MSIKQMEFEGLAIPSTIVAVGTPYTTDSIPMISKDGMYGMYLDIGGSGNLEVEELINIGGVWKSIEGRDSLAAVLTVASGDASDGVVNLSPTSAIGFCNSMKFRFTATSDSVTIEGNVLVR